MPEYPSRSSRGAGKGQAEHDASHIVDRIFDRQMLRVVLDHRSKSPGNGDVARHDGLLIVLLIASEEVSRKNSSTCSGVGGNPVKSKDARRMNVRLSAGPSGCS